MISLYRADVKQEQPPSASWRHWQECPGLVKTVNSHRVLLDARWVGAS